jgi:hypothetical protein
MGYLVSNIVYWADYLQTGYYLNIKPPQNIIQKSSFEDIPKDQNFFRCPAFVKQYKTTFNIVSPIDYDLHIDEQQFYSNSFDQDFFDKNVLQRSFKHRLASIAFPKYIFFSDRKTCTMTLGNAYYSNSSFTNNVNVLSGQFDIASWFRPVDLAFIFKEKKGGFTIKEGDPLYSVNFNFDNNESIIFKKFFMTDKLFHFSTYFMDLKFYGFDVNKYKVTEFFNQMYTMFNRSKFKQLILKEIENNLME